LLFSRKTKVIKDFHFTHSLKGGSNIHNRKVKKLSKYLGKTIIDEMLDKARNDNKSNYLILLTLWRTGIRNSELVNLKKRDIKTDELTIRQGKGHKDRIIPMNSHLSDLLQYHSSKMSFDSKLFHYQLRKFVI
jgi:integrase